VGPGVFPVPDWSAPFPGTYDYCNALGFAAAYEPLPAQATLRQTAYNEVAAGLMLHYTAMVHEHIAQRLVAPLGEVQHGGLQNPSTVRDSPPRGVAGKQKKGKGKGKGRR
jgi:hypothetical protein